MTNQKSMSGLTSEEVNKLQIQYGKNELAKNDKDSFFIKLTHILCEPMFLLLIAAAIIYFVLGEPRDGLIMLIFVVGVISIDVIQEWKTNKTLNALKKLSAPQITVIRDEKEQLIASSDLVPGDLMIVYEGIKIPADGIIIKCADLCIDESSLTGEAFGVWKCTAEKAEPNKEYWRKDYCYAGTLVIQGTAVVMVDKIGSSTEYGKIGTNIISAPSSPTPLQTQISKLIKTCAIIAGVLFLLVSVFTWSNLSNHSFYARLIESILSGVTLAMAMIPEEFPVIFTVFLSMGAWRLAKKHSLVRKLPSVETLGAVSVLCVDKTGTITKNQMTVSEAWSIDNDKNKLIETMGLACEIDAYDPMEKAMLSYCNSFGISNNDLFSGILIKEYAFTNEHKMMGHVWKRNDKITIAAKGSPEQILSLCKVSLNTKKIIEDKINDYSSNGLRVIAIATGDIYNEQAIPINLIDCNLTLLGIIGLLDPPREGIEKDIFICNNAGIRVIMITGDNGITASAIAKKIGIPNSSLIVTGEKINQMNEEQLCKAVKKVSIFSRVIPEHKMRIVKALKKNGEIVAMTGDGVNDAPALKYADIGIAMGKQGSEVSREAADLILMDDNFTTIIDTIKDGRRIYDNIRKAVGYVFTIHIPIAFSALLAPFLGISSTALLLLPLHVVLMEILIDPTCSIVLERQPAERNIMKCCPRKSNEKLLSPSLLFKSIFQGIAIFSASFGIYYYTLKDELSNAAEARTMGLAVIMISNIFLVLVNCSYNEFAFQSIKKLIKDKVMWAINIGTLLLISAIIYTPLSSYLKLSIISPIKLIFVFLISAASVFWYEIIKLFKHIISK